MKKPFGLHSFFKNISALQGLTGQLLDTNTILKVIYQPLYGMNDYVLIWGDWLSCDPLKRVTC